MALVCRLPADLLPRRLVRLAEGLSSDLLAATRAPDVLELRYARSTERIQDLARIVAEESECCAFLSFELAVLADGPTAFVVRAPPEGRSLLDLFERAATGETPGDRTAVAAAPEASAPST